MPKTHVEKSIVINAPVEKIYSIISDFNHWTAWSPWLIMEPEVKLNVKPDGTYYEWEGDRTGSGNMQITGKTENVSVDTDLTFLKPWKSKAKVVFKINEGKDGNTVSWIMDSSLPFFLFFMKSAMETFIGMDFDRGLRMLKEYVEVGTVHSKLDFTGKEKFGGYQFIGVKTTCSFDDMGQKMAEDLPKIAAYIQQNGLTMSGKPFTQYHKWDMKKKGAEYTSGVPVSEIPKDLPKEFYAGSIPATEVYTLKHTGPYQYLGNVWSTLYSMQRRKEFKSNKKIHPFETYENSPMDCAETDLVTAVHFPVN